MNDITKARHYLKSRGSKLQSLPSFPSMLSSAEQEYRNLKLRAVGNKEGISFEEKEVEAALDYAVLRYLKRHNQLPPNIKSAFDPGNTLELKRELAMVWMNA
jgi:hypothetical protein